MQRLTEHRPADVLVAGPVHADEEQPEAERRQQRQPGAARGPPAGALPHLLARREHHSDQRQRDPRVLESRRAGRHRPLPRPAGRRPRWPRSARPRPCCRSPARGRRRPGPPRRRSRRAAPTAQVAPGRPSPRIATNPAISSRPVSCATSSTTSTGCCRLFSPPRKSPAPQETLEANASSRAATAANSPIPCRGHEPRSSGIDRIRRSAHAVRRARAHAGRLRRPLLARIQLLHRCERGRPGRRRLRRGGVRGARRPRREDRRHRARGRREHVLLARPLRLRPQRRPHRRHAAERVRRLPAQAVRGVEGRGVGLPRQHPAGPPARGPRAVRRRNARRPRLDEPVDRHGARLARACDRRAWTWS